MIKRIIAAVLCLAAISSFTVGFASGSEGETKYDVLLSADFNDLSITDVTGYGLNRSGFSYSYDNGYDGYCIKIPHNSSLAVGKWFDSSFSSGRYLISYDMKCTSVAASKSLHLLSSSAGNFNVSQNNYKPLKFMSDSSIMFSRDVQNVSDYDLTQTYTMGEWYNIKEWIDMDNREQVIYINDVKAATMQLPEGFTSLQGFAIQVAPTENDSSTATFIDNIKVLKEKLNYLEGFDAVYADVSVAENIIGNNFFTDKKPEFNIYFKNRLNEEKTYNVTYEVKTKSGESIWKSPTEQLVLAQGGTVSKTLVPKFCKFGVMRLEISFIGDGESFKKTVPFTYSNRDTTAPLNYAMGAATHMNRGRGTPYEIIPLASDAGIGVIRGGDFSWEGFENTPGEYELTEDMSNIVDLLKEYDMDYMNVVHGTHSAYIGNDLSNPDDLMYEKLTTAITNLLNQTDGTIAYLENWNEYHSPSMSHELNGDPQVSAKMHKAIYAGAQAAENKAEVLAFAEDDWGLYPGGDARRGTATGLMNQTLALMGGEKCFDAVSYHPYPTPDSNYFENDKYHTNDAVDIKRILAANGYDADTPMVFSEFGWNDYILDYDDDKKADYIIRAMADIEANELAKLVCIYNFTDYAELSSETQRTYGITESYNSSASEIPYLGKESLVAVSYYNSLMTNNKNAETIDMGIGNSYCYKFTDDNDNQILMLGLYDGEERNIAVRCKSKTAVVADIYGNEEVVNTIGGVLNIKLKPQVQYIKGEFKENIITTAVVSQRPYAIVKGTAQASEELVLAVYKPNMDSSMIGTESIENVVYYYAQQKADENGNFSFALPSDLEIDSEVIAKVTGKNTRKQYYIYSHGNAVVVYNIEENADTSVTVHQTATMLSDQYTDCAGSVIIGAVYNNGALSGCSLGNVLVENGNIMVLSTDITAEQGNEVKSLFWKDLNQLIPIGKSISLY